MISLWVGDIGEARSPALIHPSAWNGNSQKFVSRILHSPGPIEGPLDRQHEGPGSREGCGVALLGGSPLQGPRELLHRKTRIPYEGPKRPPPHLLLAGDRQWLASLALHPDVGALLPDGPVA